MNIVVCTDHNYVMPCGIMLYSLCKNKAKQEVNFYTVIDESVNSQDKLSLQSIAKEFDNINLFFLPIDGHLFDGFPNLGGGIYISKATYYRLYLTDILPKSLDKVLYLDCDMIVRKDLGELWDTNINNVAAAVAFDGMDGLITLYNRLDYPIEKGYFNAGMMLINLKYWRDNNIKDQCLNYIKYNYDRIISHDQDVLNVVLQDSKIYVDITYNFGEAFLYKPKFMQFDYRKYKGVIDDFIKDPAIVHYTVSKPWKKGCMNPFITVFNNYKSKTEWKSVPLQNPQITLKGILKSTLVKLGLMHREVINPFIKINFELN